MADYEVTVITGDLANATTFNNIYIKLVSTDGESERICFKNWKSISGNESKFTVFCEKSLGRLELIEVDKQGTFINDWWYPAMVEVTSPENETYCFPIYHWISDGEVHYFREGTAIINKGNTSTDSYNREKELEQQQKVYCWDVHAKGLPNCINAGNDSLHYDVKFSNTREAEKVLNIVRGLGELELIRWAECQDKFTCLEDISHLLCIHQTATTEYVRQHWKDDAFFGYQFLNGTNPILIRSCKELPKNFPVTDYVVPIYGQNNLTEEMKKGNIFLCDYKLLDGVKTNTINDKKQYLTAPLVLLQKTEDNELMPVAIQLKQKPGEDNPIFYPTDSKYDWLLAKIFVRSADFNFYELNPHLLRTHLLAEVFTVSLLRNLPMVHPLYKLLIPHTRYTLNINVTAREKLISEDGVFPKVAASGGKGATEILRRSLASVTYTSLCIVDDIAERGLKHVPNFFYRDDGLRLWRIIYSFVKAVLGHYYKTNAQVQKDSELQNWINDIFEQGFLSKESTGIPQKFTTVDEMVKFVTMVIFTCSAQHSAVNSGQFDFGGFMPNYPTTLQLPPPTTKGTATEKIMLDTFPDVNTTVLAMATLWLLSRPSSDSVILGDYPDRHFTEEVPRQKIKDFQKELKKLSADIKVRNEGLAMPYTYLDPEVIENSVSI